MHPLIQKRNPFLPRPPILSLPKIPKSFDTPPVRFQVIDPLVPLMRPHPLVVERQVVVPGDDELERSVDVLDRV